MDGAIEQKTRMHQLFAGFIGAVAALTGIVAQVHGAQSFLIIDPGMLPFLVLLLIGLLVAAMSSVPVATIAGMFAGILLAISASIYCAVSNTCPTDTARTFVAFSVIMLFFGAVCGFVGAIPVWLWRWGRKTSPGEVPGALNPR
jgi:uncharacterized membrane protein